MIISTDSVKAVYICTSKIDFRKQIDGLISVIVNNFDMDVLDHSLYIFLNGNRSRMKAIYYDGNGFWMLVKRMEKGRFKYDFDVDKKMAVISEKQLSFLLEGLSINQKYIDKIGINSYLI